MKSLHWTDLRATPIDSKPTESSHFPNLPVQMECTEQRRFRRKRFASLGKSLEQVCTLQTNRKKAGATGGHAISQRLWGVKLFLTSYNLLRDVTDNPVGQMLRNAHSLCASTRLNL